MASDSVRAWRDKLERDKAESASRLADAAAAASSAQRLPGLRFVAGARVIDLGTGNLAIVQDGSRDPGTGEVAYRIEFAPGRIGLRLESELEPAPQAKAGLR